MSAHPTQRWTERAGTTLLAGVVLAALCVVAGMWQWQRYEDRRDAVELVEANYEAAPGDLAALVPPGGWLGPDDVWRPAVVTGRYLPDAQVLLRNRPVQGQAAFQVLHPFEITDGPLAGQVLVVNRGWAPASTDGTVPGVTAPDGEVEIVVRLRADEPASTRQAPEGQVQAVNTEQVRVAAGDPWPADRTVQAYGVAAVEDDAPPAGLGRIPRPDTSLGSHLSYAFQWWVFALGALVGSVVLVVRDRRSEQDDGADGSGADGEGAPVTAEGGRSVPAGRSRRRRPTAEEEEDALLDAQSGADRPEVRGAGSALRNR
jgi:cytochrome oxidase assembly protein ShyY1